MIRRRLLGVALSLALVFQPILAEAQFPGGGGGGGSSAAVAGGWSTAVVGTPLPVTTSSTPGTVTGSSTITEVLLTNVGASGAYCGVEGTATTSSQYIGPSGGWFPFQIGAGSQTIACITALGSTTINVQTGSGLATGAGSGGSGGSGGAVTAVSGAYADCSIVAIGCTTDNPWNLIGVATLVSTTKAIALAATSSYNAQVVTAPTVTAASYTNANASVGGLQTIPLFRTTTQPTALLEQVSVSFSSGSVITPTITVYIFNHNPTASTCTDTVAFTLGAADAPYLVTAPFTITPAVTTVSTISIGSSSTPQLPMSVKNLDSPTATQNLYECFVVATASTLTPGATTAMSVTNSLIPD